VFHGGLLFMYTIHTVILRTGMYDTCLGRLSSHEAEQTHQEARRVQSGRQQQNLASFTCKPVPYKQRTTCQCASIFDQAY
jgi:hypothetical protein